MPASTGAGPRHPRVVEPGDQIGDLARVVFQDAMAAIERAVKTEIAAAVEFAVNSPFPKTEEAERGFFA